ncbi:leukocyte surface antigen CD53 [Silurus asotus]|uniref:Leukocyte surface antigen CD53 n=1 Tax=Silurus asotus TaxID=30991 RepID=A0AAD5AYP7_SILAS|nr:leukocyte surface antigen CD53 [Silurus asotus]
MSCLKCLKYTMCVVNFIFFLCGAAIFGLGIYISTTTKYLSFFPSLSIVNLASTLFVIGIFVTSVSFLGFLGALKENRCLLISFFILLFLLMLAELTVACLLLFYENDIDNYIGKELKDSMQRSTGGGGNNTSIDWNMIQKTGCYLKLKNWFETNLLGTGIAVIVICSIEVLGMCFSMTLFCHISKSGLGYK